MILWREVKGILAHKHVKRHAKRQGVSTALIITLITGCLVVALFVWSISWTSKQTLVGTWVAALPDGSHVTLQFEGERIGDTYKQLVKREGAESREFGHWIFKMLELRLIIMATDVREHARFGVDTKYWVNFSNKDQVTINGPERPKWTFQRAEAGIKLDFDAPQTTA